MNDISPAPSIEESVQLLTSSGDDGNDPGGNNEGAYQTTHSHICSNNFHGDQGSSSHSLATNDNEMSESSQGSHSYQPNAYYLPHFEQNLSYGFIGYHLPYHMFPMNDTSYGAHNVMSFSHGMGRDQNQCSDENGDALDPSRHSVWW
ncbi:hypothetical protein GOBAR_DD28487 [Gossypium barbadense]|nr:hypothetical protein GOBAR_DD28487 [Gossypium barbadense]